MHADVDEGQDEQSIEEPLLRRNVKRFRGGLVFKAHRVVYHWRVIKKKKVYQHGPLLRAAAHVAEDQDEQPADLPRWCTATSQGYLAHKKHPPP